MKSLDDLVSDISRVTNFNLVDYLKELSKPDVKVDLYEVDKVLTELDKYLTVDEVYMLQEYTPAVVKFANAVLDEDDELLKEVEGYLDTRVYRLVHALGSPSIIEKYERVTGKKMEGLNSCPICGRRLDNLGVCIGSSCNYKKIRVWIEREAW